MHTNEAQGDTPTRLWPHLPGFRQFLPNAPGNAIPLLGFTYIPRYPPEFSLSGPSGGETVASAERSQEA